MLQGDGLFPAKYRRAAMNHPNTAENTQQLDPYHTHFILVDDGSRESFDGEAKWREKFEKFLSDSRMPQNPVNNIPSAAGNSGA